MNTTAQAPAESSPFCSASQRRYVLIAAVLASSLGFIDGSIVSIAIPSIRADLGASFLDAQWISNAYALALSTLILIGGAAGDRFGLRRTFIAGVALFIVASVACGLASNATALIICRAVQGIGAAIMTPCSLAIIAKAYPKAERGRAIGLWAAASGMTTALGPVIGGLILSRFDASAWRIIFLINLPLGAIALYLLFAKVPSDRPQQTQRLDVTGAALAALGFGALAYGLTTMSAEDAGQHFGAIFAAMAVGVIGVATFIIWELKHPAPMVDLRLFRSNVFTGTNLATFFLYFSLSAVLFYLPMLLIAGWGVDPTQVGIAFVPLSAAIALLSGAVGKLSDRVGPRIPLAAGSLLVGAAFAALGLAAHLDFHSFWGAVMPAMIIMALGMTLVVSPLSTAVMTAVDDKDTGAASGINNAVSRVAGLIAVAAMGALAAFVYGMVLRSSPVAAGISQSFGEAAKGLAPALDTIRIDATDQAFAAVAYVSVAFCLAAAAASWFMLQDPSTTKLERL